MEVWYGNIYTLYHKKRDPKVSSVKYSILRNSTNCWSSESNWGCFCCGKVKWEVVLPFWTISSPYSL